MGAGASLRADVQGALKAAYVDPIIEIARMTARAPIVNLNHDLRFVAAGGRRLQKRAEKFHGFQAMGTYIALELGARMRGGTRLFVLVENGLPVETVNHWNPYAISGRTRRWGFAVEALESIRRLREAAVQREDGDSMLHGPQQDQGMG